MKTAEIIGRPSRGYDAGKMSNGRKRHIAVDTRGLLLCVLVTAASTQDRTAPGRPLLTLLAASCQHVRLVCATGGYAGKLPDWDTIAVKITVRIVKRSDDTTGLVVLRRRCVGE